MNSILVQTRSWQAFTQHFDVLFESPFWQSLSEAHSFTLAPGARLHSIFPIRGHKSIVSSFEWWCLLLWCLFLWAERAKKKNSCLLFNPRFNLFLIMIFTFAYAKTQKYHNGNGKKGFHCFFISIIMIIRKIISLR